MTQLDTERCRSVQACLEYEYYTLYRYLPSLLFLGLLMTSQLQLTVFKRSTVFAIRVLHAVHCSTTGSNAVMVVSEDTDVFVLCVGYLSQVPCPLYIKCGSKTRTHYFHVKKVAQMLGADKCKALLELHAFTGVTLLVRLPAKESSRALVWSA